MTKADKSPPAVRFLDPGSFNGLPNEIEATIVLPVTDDLAKLVLKQMTDSLADDAVATAEVRDGKIVIGVSLAPGETEITFDLEEHLLLDAFDTDMQPTIAALKRLLQIAEYIDANQEAIGTGDMPVIPDGLEK